MPEFNLIELRSEILAIVKKEGPILPAQISSKVSSSVLFTSAILSELVAQNKIKISKAKVGGSPLYYHKGQEAKLNILYDRSLKEIHKKVYDLLNEGKILRDKDLEHWQRVAMDEIKDFAIKLEIKYNGEEEIFWKWYLIPDNEVKPKIIEILKVIHPQPEEEEAEKTPESKEEIKAEEPKEEIKVPEPKQEIKEDIKEEIKLQEEPKKELEVKKEAPVEKKEEAPKVVEEQPAEDVQQKLEKPKVEDTFMDTIRDYFEKNNIKIETENLIRKNNDAEFIVHLPSELGDLKYYVKAKNKKKINDAELLMIYTQGEKQKLPVILLSTGELTKKAEKYIEDELKGLVFRKLTS